MSGLLVCAGLLLGPAWAATGPSPGRGERLARLKEDCRARLVLWEPGAAGPSPIPLSPVGFEPAKDYYRCMALAKDQEYCDGLDRLGPLGSGGKAEPSQACRDVYRDLTIWGAISSRDPRAAAVCERTMEPVLGPKTSRGCAVLLSGGSPKEVCRRLFGGLGMQKSRRELVSCLTLHGLAVGQAVDCAELKADPTVHRECLALDGYRRAFSGKDPDLCGDLPLCRALMGAGPAACAGLLARARDVSCEHWASVKFVEQLPAIEAEEKAAAARAAAAGGR